jgi:hypothetical protein
MHARRARISQRRGRFSAIGEGWFFIGGAAVFLQPPGSLSQWATDLPLPTLQATPQRL